MFNKEQQELIDKVVREKQRGDGYIIIPPYKFSLETEEGQRCYCLSSLIRAEVKVFHEPRKASKLACYPEISLLAQQVVEQYFASEVQKAVCSFLFMYDNGRDITTIRKVLKLL